MSQTELASYFTLHYPTSTTATCSVYEAVICQFQHQQPYKTLEDASRERALYEIVRDHIFHLRHSMTINICPSKCGAASKRVP